MFFLLGSNSHMHPLWCHTCTGISFSPLLDDQGVGLERKLHASTELHLTFCMNHAVMKGTGSSRGGC